MGKIKDGGPAFAAMGVSPAGDVFHETGMTLRDWFAGQAMMQGMAVLVASQHNLNDHQLGVLARTAYAASDAMLAAREVAP